MHLTTEEYNEGLTNTLKGFVNSQDQSWRQHIYKAAGLYNPVKGKMLFLFSYALDTWEHSDTAVNYLTERQMMLIISKANQLS